MPSDETSFAEIVLIFAFLATLFAIGHLNTKLMRKVLNGRSAFSEYGRSSQRGIDALWHRELYLMLACFALGNLLIIAIFARHGCDKLNKFPSFIRATCALIEPIWMN